MIGKKHIESAMGNDGDLRHGYRRDIMIEPVQRITRKIHEIARNMHRHELAQAVPIIDIARQYAFDQQRALVQDIARPDDGRSWLQAPDLADGAFEQRTLFRLQGNAALFPQEAFGKNAATSDENRRESGLGNDNHRENGLGRW